MKNAKRILASLLAITMLAGCGNEPTNNQTPDPTPTQTASTPTTAPTSTPTVAPTTAPTSAPTAVPTVAPTTEPAYTPTGSVSDFVVSDARPLSIEANRTKDKGVIQLFGQSEDTLKEAQSLVENQEFTTRQMENLDRGLVAINNGNGVFVSWRWLGSESNTVTYNLYRNGEKVNAYPLNVTNYTDTLGNNDCKYQVAAVVDGVEQEKCAEVSVWSNGYYEIQLVNRPTDNETGATYTPNDMSTADLDGDGKLELVLKWDPSNSKDNSHTGKTGSVYIDAYKLDGTFMWRINLGRNIRAGAHYTQFMVYDLDGDGKAEVVCKTADGTTDALGTVIGDANADYRTSDGTILTGPEYLTVFEGATGKALDTVDYEVPREDTNLWGDGYGNRSERYLACIAYLNGTTPSVVMCRGYYTRATMAAYNFVNGKLEKLWVFDSDADGAEYRGQGNHSVTVADVDMDGKDEIIYGAALIDDNGKGVYSTGLGHGDAQHTGDLIPYRPGIETFSVHEDSGVAFGMEMRDTRTGEILWGSYENSDVGRGVSADVDPDYVGCESWAAGKMVAADGTLIATNPGIASNFVIYWDGDLGEEVQDGNHIDKWESENNATTMLTFFKDYTTCNGTKATPCLTADILGDWREETVLYSTDGNKIAVYSTTIPTEYKIYTLMHDLQYRTYIATQNVAYNQPAHTGFYLGYDTTEIPVPRVSWTVAGQTVVNPDLAAGDKYYSIEGLKAEESVVLKVDGSYALVNGNVQCVDSELNKVAPYLDSSEVFVPISFINEAFDVEASVKVGSKKIAIDGKGYDLSLGAQLIGEKVICVPLQSVAQALGKNYTMTETGMVIVDDRAEIPSSDVVSRYAAIIDNYAEPAEDDSSTTIKTAKALERRIPVVAASASSVEEPNVAANAVDDNFDTRWNAWGDNSILTLDFGEEVSMSAVAATFYKCTERTYYFDIEISNDGENWEQVLVGVESYITMDKELGIFRFPETKTARYLRYVGHNSSQNDANNIWELMVLKP